MAESEFVDLSKDYVATITLMNARTKMIVSHMILPPLIQSQTSMEYTEQTSGLSQRQSKASPGYFTHASQKQVKDSHTQYP